MTNNRSYGWTKTLLGLGAFYALTFVASAQTPAQRDALLTRIQALEKRVEDLEKLRLLVPNADDAKGKTATTPGERLPTAQGSGGTVTRVQAPFEVVARDGRPIARILEWGDLAGGVYTYNRAGKPAAILGPVYGDNGGRVAVYNGSGSQAGAATFSFPPGAQGAHLVMTRLDSDTGIALDASTGEINLFNSQGYAAVALKSGESGAGRLTLGDAAGKTVVEAGSTKAGIGIVRVGPRLGGTTGVTQGGMVLPHAIVGQK
jgi:hypothetical protein